MKLLPKLNQVKKEEQNIADGVEQKKTEAANKVEETKKQASAAVSEKKETKKEGGFLKKLSRKIASIFN